VAAITAGAREIATELVAELCKPALRLGGQVAGATMIAGERCQTRAR
jgi:hypothetical protein